MIMMMVTPRKQERAQHRAGEEPFRVTDAGLQPNTNRH
jgi:hypothetical protein